MRIFLIGFMGSGKTTLGKQLAEKLKYEFIDLDNFIETKHKYSIQSIFNLVGEDGFRKLEKVCLDEVIKLDNIIVSTGGGTPYFFNNIENMNENGITIYLKVPAETLITRLSHSRLDYRPLLKGKNSEELSEYVKSTLAERENVYTQAQIIVESENIEIKGVLDKLTSFSNNN